MRSLFPRHQVTIGASAFAVYADRVVETRSGEDGTETVLVYRARAWDTLMLTRISETGRWSIQPEVGTAFFTLAETPDKGVADALLDALETAMFG